MTTAAAKVRYEHNDQATYVHVLRNVEPLSCFPEDSVPDQMLFMRACYAATEAVPMNDAPAGAFNRHAYVAQRLQEAVDYRNRFYRLNLPALA